MKLSEVLLDIGRPVAFYPGLKKITGTTNNTLFLCQLIYWRGKQADPDGWTYKVSAEITEETGLTYEEQKTARAQLVGLGFIREKYEREEHRLSFMVDIDKIDEAWASWQSLDAQAGTMAKPRCHQGDATVPPSQSHDGTEAKPSSLNRITETTPEITTQTTREAEVLKFSKQTLKGEAGPQIYKECVEPLQFQGLADGVFTVTLPDRAAAELARGRIMSRLQRLISGSLGQFVIINITSRQEEP